ncbi:MAG: hypothetical protein P8M22_04570 [Phycisphaerales bacterium]|nr:hypothetical protein [Phycisphaerales bacterium]
MHLPLLTILFLCFSTAAQSPPTAQPAPAQSVAAAKPIVLPLARGLMNRYVQAIGGRVALWQLESFKAHAKLSFKGGQAEGQLDLAFRRPNLMRIQLDLASLGSSEVGSDGSSAWEILTSDGIKQAEIIPLVDAQRRRRDLNWFELALRLTDGARSFRTVAPAEYDGHPCWEIQKIARDGSEERIFIDRQNHLLRGIRMIETGMAEEHEVSLSFRNWKSVGDLLLFHELIMARDGIELVIDFDQISLDTVSPNIFQPPDSIQELLRSIPGNESSRTPAEETPQDSGP